MTVEEFNKLSKNEKAVLVANDILTQVAKGVYDPTSSIYVDSLSFFDTTGDYSYESSLKDLVPHIQYCEVCACGAAVLSVTKFANVLLYEDIDKSPYEFALSGKIKYLLLSVFTKREICMIENSFEDIPGYNHTRIINHSILTQEEVEFCEKVYSSFIYPDDRLIYIFSNIIKNNGEYVIEELDESER